MGLIYYWLIPSVVILVTFLISYFYLPDLLKPTVTLGNKLTVLVISIIYPIGLLLILFTIKDKFRWRL